MRRLPKSTKAVIAPFGLSNEGPPAEDKIGPFPVESQTQSELVAGFNDKHLAFSSIRHVSIWQGLIGDMGASTQF
ncbi:MAG: hypothetical protein ACI9DC_000016 [Gammaproteobacteria bacterium]|jgi:hypothetical protein